MSEMNAVDREYRQDRDPCVSNSESPLIHHGKKWETRL